MKKILKINKKITNLIFSVLLLMFVTLTFSACAQVRVMTITNADDTIDELVSITIYPEEVLSAGYDLQELKLDIEAKSKAQAQTMVDKLNNKINNDLLLVQDLESVQTLNSFKNGITVVNSEWEENTYVVGIRFKNIDIYKYYYNISENVKTEMYTEEHFFYNKVYYYANTMFVKHNELYNLINTYYSNEYPYLIDSENNQLLYTYKTDMHRQHSDADYITRQNGEYYHTWVVDPNNIDEPIMLYYNVANPENSILLAIGVTFGVTLIMFIVSFVINKTKNKNNEIQYEQIKKEDN